MEINVVASRWENGWELDIEGVGMTQSASLKDAKDMITDYLILEGYEGPFNIKIQVDGVTMYLW